MERDLLSLEIQNGRINALRSAMNAWSVSKGLPAHIDNERALRVAAFGGMDEMLSLYQPFMVPTEGRQ